MDTSSAATHDEAISCVSDFKVVSDILDSSLVETSWSFFLGRCDGIGKAIFDDVAKFQEPPNLLRRLITRGLTHET